MRADSGEAWVQQIVLAGASSVFGLSEIREAFRSLGIEAVFAEAPYMKKYQDCAEQDDIEFCGTIPHGKKAVLLSEYWISECIKSGNCLVCEKALRAGRSKKFFYSLLKNTQRVPELYSSPEEARRYAELTGGTILVKPDGLFSGYGIKIVQKDNLCSLEKYMFNAARLHNNALKLFSVTGGSVLLSEYVCGTEFSADIFYFRGAVAVVRVCRKEIAVIHNTPCAAVYQLAGCSEKISACLEKWAHAVFESDDISFGQFDFIQTDGDEFVPVDFAPRVGGGIRELLMNCKENPYALAVKSLSCHEASEIPEKKAEETMALTQCNYLPTKSGIISNDCYRLLPGIPYIFKHAGDFVPECPSSAASRIAATVSMHRFPIEKELLPLLLVGDEHISFWKKKQGQR